MLDRSPKFIRMKRTGWIRETRPFLLSFQGFAFATEEFVESAAAGRQAKLAGANLLSSTKRLSAEAKSKCPFAVTNFPFGSGGLNELFSWT